MSASSNFRLYFGTVPTVWYFFVFVLDFETVPTMWYFGTVFFLFHSRKLFLKVNFKQWWSTIPPISTNEQPLTEHKKTTIYYIRNLCPDLEQAQRPLTLEIYVLAWQRHKDHWHWKSMSWLGRGTKTTDIGNLCPGLGEAQRPLTLEIYVLAWDRHKGVVGLTMFMGIQPSTLDNTGSPTAVYINNDKRTCADS